MVQDDGPRKRPQRGLFEVPGPWSGAHLSARATNITSLVNLAPAPEPRQLRAVPQRIMLLGEDVEALDVISTLLARLGRARYEVGQPGEVPAGAGRDQHRFQAVVVASDPGLTDGMSAYGSLRAAGFCVPVIMVASGVEEETADRAIELGAAEVLEAVDLDAHTLDRAIQTAMTRHRREARLQTAARRDDLTGLANRVSFRDRLDHALTLARRGNGKVALLMIDLDGFKAVNDRHGHPFGDELLKKAGERMRSRIRESDTIGRLGGDEFGVLLPSVQRREDTAVVIRKLLETIRPPIEVDGQPASITASIGVAVFPDDAAESVRLTRLADAAMYRAKRAGGNRCCWHGDGRPNLGPEAEELIEAFTTEAVAVVVRPQMALRPMKAAVAGLRPVWHHPQCGSLDLLNLRALVEEAGLIDRLTACLLNVAVSKLKSWHRQGYHGVEAAIPMLSRRRLAWAGLAEQMADCAAKHGVSTQYLQIEIDEQQLVEDMASGGHGAASFRRAGIRLAIDRFGSGATSLGLFTAFQPASVRFCEATLDPGKGSAQLKLCQAVAALARALDIRTVATGADDPDRMAMAREIGVDAVESAIAYAHASDSCLPWLQISRQRAAEQAASGEVHAAVDQEHLAGH